jgi:hypothetical protein
VTWASAALLVRPGIPVPFGVNLRAILLVYLLKIMATFSYGSRSTIPQTRIYESSSFASTTERHPQRDLGGEHTTP